ncbi:response regulator [Candidatus Magnetaquicoccus inordinatus]|uniref:response regulator n=1 Tax=Candidatus Magnetaquicoccus inordinatus TaxID=2496818 RepID=UPI00102C67F6|nr:response regulator [Candidatus Magnetaquicoccus inordinatus]
MAHILVVDDDPDILALLSEILQQSGHTLDVAENGNEALHILSQTPVALLITDIFMPEIDGIDLIANLLREYPQLPIIAMSGGYRAMNPQLTLRMASMFGAQEIISKPLLTSMVQQAVERTLQRTAKNNWP